jgi:pyridoxine 5-phosphate synthase
MVSIFIDPDVDQIKRAQDVNADMVEIHTGAFCDAPTRQDQNAEFEKVVDAAKFAHSLNLEVNAGHGLGYETINFFKGLSVIDEFSIGHSIISRSVFVGIERAVKEMVALIKAI